MVAGTAQVRPEAVHPDASPPSCAPRPLPGLLRTAAARLVAAGTLAAAASSPGYAATVTDPFTLSTIDQGMWAADRLQGLGGTNTYEVFNRTFPNATFGDIVQTQVPGTGGTIPNPAWAVWRACIVASPFDPLCGGEPATTIPNPIPAQYLRNGAELRLSNMHLDFGVRTTLQLAPGSIASTVLGAGSLTAPDGPVAAGQLVTLGSAGGASGATLASDFDLINVGITPYVNLTARAVLEAWAAGINVIPSTEILNLPIHANTEFVGARIGDGGIELRAFGNDTFVAVPSGVGTNIGVPGIVPWPLSLFVGFPMGDVRLFVPQLDTPPQSVFDVDTGTVTNTQDTTTRLGGTGAISFGRLGIGVSGPTAIDFGQVNVDLDVLSLLAGYPLGLTAGVPLTAMVEINALDLDFGTYFGIGQNLSLTPGDIVVDLAFSAPVQVETAPGVFELLSAWTIRLGDPLSFLHPGGDLEVTPTYRLSDNTFSNLTQLFLTPGFTLDFMQLRFSGALFSALGLGDYRIFSQFIPVTGEPLPVYDFTDTDFALGGWTVAEGTALRILASAAAVPAPGTLLLLCVGVVALGFARRRYRAG